MGTSSNESDHASSPKVSEHETRTNGDLEESSPIAAANELNSVTSSKNLDTSSSSLSHSPLPDSPVEHPHNTTTPSQTEVEGNDNLDSNLDTGYEHEIPTAESPASTPDDEMLLFTLDSGDDKENHEIYNAYVALSTLSPELTDSTLELGSNAPTTSPPTQVMERPSGSKYRIPSSVFARSMSNTPDWSCASNESLFSIRMGNMSFRTDDFWKSGEIGLKSAELEMIKNELEMQSGDLGIANGGLGTGTSHLELIPGEPVTTTEPFMSSQMFSYSQTPNMATSNSGKTAELGVAIETMKEVIREAADHRSKNSISDGSVAGTTNNRSSTESFAFSSGADNSLRGGITVKSDRGSSPAPTQSTSQPKKEQEPKSPAAALQTAKTGWFSWMSCYWCRPYCCL
ncbi:hypothetical protein DCAR_0313066 [Daucus carota subsp. sativus]|uniref:Uncharacterized protein n=1 Tax=Daucus carota subsp. sativus TaxID=79200 RepID=A0AAF1ASI0_DAUCS|nr:hypothetical protein DCAR_0313066 [Daucus carota subsp. sativus]